MNWSGILFSPTGGTRNIIKTLFTGIEGTYKGYDLTKPSNRKHVEKKELVFSERDAVVVGVPVYGGRVPPIIVNALKQIRGNNTPAVFIVVYGNRAYEDALLELKNIMEENGFIGIAAGAFIAEHSFTSKVGTNRPDKADMMAAHEFGKAIKAKLNDNLSFEEKRLLSVPGNEPYKESKPSAAFAPSTANFCVQCSVCAKLCPAGAIDIKDCKIVDAEKCIHCCCCVKICPVKAKKLDSPQTDKIREFLISTCSKTRKEPELFI